MKPEKKITSTKKSTTSPSKKTTKTVKKTTSNKTTPTKTTPKKASNITKTTPKITKETNNKSSKNNAKLVFDPKVVIVIILAFILCTIIIVKGMFNQTANNFSESYLLSNKIISNELNPSMIEDVTKHNESFILITKYGTEEEYLLEKGLTKIIEDNNLENKFSIFNVDKNNVDINTAFNLSGYNIKVPTILYYKNGHLLDMVKRDDENMIEAADFAKLLDIYEITK